MTSSLQFFCFPFLGLEMANIFCSSRLHGGKDASRASHRDRGEVGAMGRVARLWKWTGVLTGSSLRNLMTKSNSKPSSKGRRAGQLVVTSHFKGSSPEGREIPRSFLVGWHVTIFVLRTVFQETHGRHVQGEKLSSM